MSGSEFEPFDIQGSAVTIIAIIIIIVIIIINIIIIIIVIIKASSKHHHRHHHHQCHHYYHHQYTEYDGHVIFQVSDFQHRNLFIWLEQNRFNFIFRIPQGPAS